MTLKAPFCPRYLFPGLPAWGRWVGAAEAYKGLIGEVMEEPQSLAAREGMVWGHHGWLGELALQGYKWWFGVPHPGVWTLLDPGHSSGPAPS